jgi:hypothetical protein
LPRERSISFGVIHALPSTSDMLSSPKTVSYSRATGQLNID